MMGKDAVPTECQGVDFSKAVDRMSGKMGALYLSAGEQRLRELDQAMAAGSPSAVMDAAHSLASLTGLWPIKALEGYAREIYAAGERNELAAAHHAHERLQVVLGWVLVKLRSLGYGANAL